MDAARFTDPGIAARRADEHRWWALPAGPAVAALCLLCFANGSAARIVDSLRSEGLAGAVLGTFGLSAVTWLGFAAAIDLARRSFGGHLSGPDAAAAAAVLVMALLPVGPLSWIGLTGLAILLLRRPGARPLAWVLLALAGNMAWGRWLMLVAGEPILAADAWLVGQVTGAAQAGNTVGSEDAPFVFIAPACSSASNLSVAVLAVTLCVHYLGLFRGGEALLRGALACVLVLAVNVGRIAAMMAYPDWFEWLHDGDGALLAGWVTVAAVTLPCTLGTGRGQRPSS